MTLRFFAGLGALLSSISGLALISSVDIGAGESLIALSCLIISGAVLYRVMGTPDVETSGRLVFVRSHNERCNYL